MIDFASVVEIMSDQDANQRAGRQAVTPISQAFPLQFRIVPGALNPIYMNLDKDEGTYIEPNVWIVHEI